METTIVIGGAAHGYDRSSLPTPLEPSVGAFGAPTGDGPRRRGRSGLDAEARPAPFFDPTLDGTPAGRR